MPLSEREQLAALIEDSSGVSTVMADLVAGEILAAGWHNGAVDHAA